MASQTEFVSTTSATRQKIVAALKQNKRYRDAFVEAHIKATIPAQIRALRRKRGWSQKKLGVMAGGIAQEVISRLESPGYGKLTLATALRLASGFDVALEMRFVPFSDLVDRTTNFDPKKLIVPRVNEDPRLDDPYPAPALVLPSGNTSARDQLELKNPSVNGNSAKVPHPPDRDQLAVNQQPLQRVGAA
jgi:transcriptional regulator with XRE-family HTH domain